MKIRSTAKRMDEEICMLYVVTLKTYVLLCICAINHCLSPLLDIISFMIVSTDCHCVMKNSYLSKILKVNVAYFLF